jgi:hypothetical protein
MVSIYYIIYGITIMSMAKEEAGSGENQGGNRKRDPTGDKPASLGKAAYPYYFSITNNAPLYFFC